MEKVKCSICGKEVGKMMAYRLKDGYACGTCFDEAIGKIIGFGSINSEEFSVETVRDGLANNKMFYEQEESFCEEKDSEESNSVDEENSAENESNEKNRENTNQNASTEEKEEKPTTNTGKFKLKYFYYGLLIIGIIFSIKYYAGENKYIETLKEIEPFNNGVSCDYAFSKEFISTEWDYFKQDGVKIVQFKGEEKASGNKVLIQFKVTEINKEYCEFEIYRMFIDDTSINANWNDLYYWFTY